MVNNKKIGVVEWDSEDEHYEMDVIVCKIIKDEVRVNCVDKEDELEGAIITLKLRSGEQTSNGSWKISESRTESSRFTETPYEDESIQEEAVITGRLINSRGDKTRTVEFEGLWHVKGETDPWDLFISAKVQ